jgi:hypothetical protein
VRRRATPQGDQFLLQGDQASQPDGWISDSQVYGRVAAVERAGKRFDMNSPVSKILGFLAALSSRWGLGRRGWSTFAEQRLKHLPLFYWYLF